MLKHILSVLAFMAVSFGVQGINHFVLNKSHYANIVFARAEPIMALGFLAMVIQGSILSFALAKYAPSPSIRDGVILSLAFGLFLAVYVAFAEPAKYAAPSISSWVSIEGAASLIQFSIFGVLLGFIHSKLV